MILRLISSLNSLTKLHSWTYDLLVERASLPSYNKPASNEFSIEKHVASSANSL